MTVKPDTSRPAFDPGGVNSGGRDGAQPDRPDATRRGLLGGAGLLLGGAALAAADHAPAAAAPADEPMQPGRDADAGRPTEHRKAYYRLARF